MTTPPLADPRPQPYPPFPASPPPLPGRAPRGRGALVAGTVAVLVLALCGGAAWWLTRSDGDPLAGRPRVTDSAAGLSYAIPEGWKDSGREKLIGAFTSSVGPERAEREGGSTVLAGRAGPVPEEALKPQAERAARSNAVFFSPDGRSTLEESRATKVSGRPAHTVVLRLEDGEGGTGHLRMTLVQVDAGRSAFLLGIALPAGPDERHEVDAVLESASVK
ncbi:hypothetical protein [Streptomyces albireticuli]|uniref:hypothetical protein n=1 Tax=Streptomyces albireticuli TaxID=1940 RepID=UPI00133170B4|nr:hypothetical protein [Streptomyces albireticuli]